MAYRIVGTAGHIDHGKSSLVEALTGAHPDRLQEEIERGITIDLGFADATIEEFHVGFVDVPGHERFVKNMLAGVGGIDAVLIAVAADESAMPQTREHLAICHLLGVDAGIVALTKCDLVDDEMLELVELEVIDLLEETRLEGAPIVRTSSTTGEGLDDLTANLADVLRRLAPRASGEALRLPVDRVFTVRGFGTVVTGTLLAGSIQIGDRSQALPGDSIAAVRGLQIHGEDARAAHEGQRVAINLHGVGAEKLSRGMVLTRPDELTSSYVLDLRVEPLPGFVLEHRQRVRFHHGSAELLGRLVLFAGDETSDIDYAQIRLESPYPAVPGDRVVLRRYSPVETIAGAEVLDAHPPKRRRGRQARHDLATLDALEEVGRCRQWILGSGAQGLDEASLAQRTGRNPDRFAEILAALTDAPDLRRISGTPALWLGTKHLDEASAAVLTALERFHAEHPLREGLEHGRLRAHLEDLPTTAANHVLDLLATGDEIASGDGFASLAAHQIRLDAAQESARASLLAAFAGAGLAAPPAAEILSRSADRGLAEELLHLLIRTDALVRLNDQYVVAASCIQELIQRLHGLVEPGSTFSIAEFKEWTGLSRRHSIPVLEHLDRTRVTRRVGDDRVLN